MVRVLFAMLAAASLRAASTLTLSPDGLTVYDSGNNISWLANANLPASNRFGLPVCNATGVAPCINASGSMSYTAATAWIQAMNEANYLGHTDWQLPTTPITDKGCGKTGPQNNSFGFGCTLGALGHLYYSGLGLKPPATAVPIPNTPAGSFSNFQPYLYWSQTAGSGGNATLSFNSGFQGANTADNFLYTLPMIAGKVTGTGFVYDSITNVTWLANANLAATNAFGLPVCTSPTTPALCVAQDGSMTMASAKQFIANMNGAAYLGQTNWDLPTLESCTGFNCSDAGSPLAELYSGLLALSPGTSVVQTPNITVGPFNNIQPYLYWECGADTIQQSCQYDAAPNFEWSFSFGNGFLGTDLLQNDLYVTAYFAGSPSLAAGPVIAEVANAEGESPMIAPNTWLEIKGVNLAPDTRVWQNADFVNNQMPTQLDKVNATVNGKNAYIYYISSTQINVLTPPDAISGPVQVIVTNNGVTVSFTAQAQAISPSFFVFNGGPYVAATHANGTYLGPTTLYPGATTPAKPGETVVLYANGFGPTSIPVASGSIVQSGTLSPLPVIKIGNVTASVQFAGLVSPGEYQFNVVVPSNLTSGDQPVTATYNGQTTQPGTFITIQK